MAMNGRHGNGFFEKGLLIRNKISPWLLRLFLALALAGFCLTPGGLAAQGAKSGKLPAPAFNPQNNFTIQKIEPDSSQEEVKIHFSAPVNLDALRYNLRLLPRIKVEWDRSTVSPEGVLTLRGAFRYGSGHYVSLPDHLAVGGKTYVPTITQFVMPDRPAKVEFVEDKRVIERDSRQLLHVRTVNVKEVYLEALRVPPLLLPQALAAEQSGQDLGQALEQLRAAAEQLKPLVGSKSAYAPFLSPALRENQLFPAGGAKNRLAAVSLPLSFRQQKESGALELIRVKDNREGSQSATGLRLFRLTDLGLTFKISGQNLLLWATSLKAGAPAAGVQVLAFTRNLEVFPLGVTDKDGVLLITAQDREGLNLKQLGAFKPVNRKVALEEVAFLMAGQSGDVSFIEVKPDSYLKPKDIWQVSAKEQPRNLKGQVFTERGVYRPGEKVFFKGTVREYQDGSIKSPQGQKCFFEVTNPRGESVFKSAAQLSEFGTAAGEMATQPHWAVGTYTLVMRFGSPEQGEESQTEDEEPEYDEDGVQKVPAPKKGAANITFQIQEFKPPRHFTEIGFERVQKPDKSFVNRERTAEFVKIVISGGYYAGGPVKHGQVRWKIHQARTDYQVPGLDGYTFGYTGKEQGDLIESGQAILDEQGKTTVEFPLDRNLLSGRQGLSVVGTVVDFDGRAATSTKVYQVDPDILVGISRHPDKVQMREPQDLKLVVVNRQGQKVTQGTLKAEILEKSYAYVAKRNEQGDLYWDDETAWRRTQASDVALKKGEGSFRFDCGQSGKYILAFTYTDEKGNRFTSASPLQVAWEYRRDDKDRPYEPLGLWADRPAYKPGDIANLSISPRGPVSWYLVTIEREGLLSHQVVAAGAGPKTLPLSLKAEYAPNIYISVLGLSPRGDFPVYAGRYDTEAPRFVWGNLNIPVLKEPEGLEVKISPAAKELKAQPNTQVTLDLAVANPQGQGIEAEMALAVVDEAVLALTGFKTPSLEQLTRFDRPLNVFTGELRTSLMHQTPFYPSRIDPLTGGGGLSGEMMSRLRKKFEAVAYFNPSLRTDPQGKAQVSFTLPDNITSYRIYAVVADRGSRFANSERQLVAAKEFYLEPGLPSFFIRGDRFRFQVAAFNAGQVGGPVKFSAAATPGLKLLSQEPTLQLEPKGSLKFNVTGEALTTGKALARFGGTFLGKIDAVELPIRVNSGLVLDTTSQFGSFSGAGDAKIALPSYLTAAPEGKLNLEEVQAVLTLSGSPFVRFARPINYLLHYPYGCVEQTSSGVLGLVAIRGLIKDDHIQGLDPAAVDRFLNSGISRLFNLQTAQGGFAYWPGNRYPHTWGTIYAVSALSLAKVNGLPVWQGGLDKSIKFLRNRVLYQEPSPLEKAFACYLLALNGALNKEAYNHARKDELRLPREGKILLLLAAHQAKLRSPGELKTLLKPLLEAKEEVQEVPRPENDFDAHYRGQALALLAAKAIMPDDPATRAAAQKLLGGLGHGGVWTSTSDTGWSLLALGEYFKGVSFSQEPGQVTVTQPGVAPQTITLDPQGSRSLTLDAKALLKQPAVRVQGKPGRTWLYQVDLTAPRLDLVQQGADRGFKITKTVKNTDGSDVIKVGDLVKVTLSVDVGRTMKYVVLDDPLPAGLVAVNSAFETEEPIPAGEDKEESPFDYFTADGAIRFRPNYFQIREDRVLAFRDLVYPGSYRYQYYARAVCEGNFALPSSKAQAMYSPGVEGFSPQSQIAVQAR